MSILALGGEMGFFVPSDSSAIEESSSGQFNPSFARGYSKCDGDSSYLQGPAISAQANFWLHVDLSLQTILSDSPTFKTAFTLKDALGTEFVRLRTTGAASSSATWKVEYWNGSAWTSVGEFDAPSVLQTVDVHVISNTASGSINLYLSGTQRIGSGTINLAAYAGVAQFIGYGRTYGLAFGTRFSQVIYADESTIGMRVGTLVMTGQGSTHTFTVGGFANIDELVYSDADEINSATAAQVELFTGTPVPSFTGYTIRALAIYARAKKSGSGPAQMQLALRSAGTTYFSATKALDFAYGQIGNVWETNPATSAAFQSSEIAALEYGVKSIT